MIMRGLLSLAVVIWHVGEVNAVTPHWMNLPGRTAVWMFFGISGYVISYGFFTGRYRLAAGDLGRFYVNRFLRIYPLFILVSLATLVTAYFLKGSILIGVGDIPRQLLMVQFNHEYTLSGVFWTLGVEVQFYLLAPLFLSFVMPTLFGKDYRVGILYFLLLTWIPLSHFLLHWSFDGRNILSVLSHFFAGIAGCKWLLEKKHLRFNKWLLLTVLVSVLLVTNFWYQSDVRYYWTIGAFLIDIAIVAAIFLHGHLQESHAVKPAFALRSLFFLGTISYGIYAWHGYLLAFVPRLEHNTIVTVCASLAVAYVSYRLVEKPALQLKKQWYKREMTG